MVAPLQPLNLTPPAAAIIQQPALPVPAEVPAQLSQPDFSDPVDLVIIQAQLRTKAGEDSYNQGALKQAKEEFDSAVDLILETAETYAKERPLQRELVAL